MIKENYESEKERFTKPTNVILHIESGDFHTIQTEWWYFVFFIMIVEFRCHYTLI